MVSTYDYHFIINQLANTLDGQLECLEENTEKYITFSVSNKKLDNGKTFHTNISTRFIDTSLSKFVDKYMYLDANSLYGWAMSQKLHENCFK